MLTTIHLPINRCDSLFKISLFILYVCYTQCIICARFQWVLNVKTFSILSRNRTKNKRDPLRPLHLLVFIHFDLKSVLMFRMNKNKNKNKFAVVGELVYRFSSTLNCFDFIPQSSRRHCRCCFYLFNTFSNGGNCW